MLQTCESGAPDVLSALSKRGPDHEGSPPCLHQDHQSSLILTHHIVRDLTIVKWTSCVCLAFLKLSLQCHKANPPLDVLPWYHTLKSSLSIAVILWCRALRDKVTLSSQISPCMLMCLQKHCVAGKLLAPSANCCMTADYMNGLAALACTAERREFICSRRKLPAVGWHTLVLAGQHSWPAWNIENQNVGFLQLHWHYKGGRIMGGCAGSSLGLPVFMKHSCLTLAERV